MMQIDMRTKIISNRCLGRLASKPFKPLGALLCVVLFQLYGVLPSAAGWWSSAPSLNIVYVPLTQVIALATSSHSQTFPAADSSTTSSKALQQPGEDKCQWRNISSSTRRDEIETRGHSSTKRRSRKAHVSPRQRCTIFLCTLSAYLKKQFSVAVAHLLYFFSNPRLTFSAASSGISSKIKTIMSRGLPSSRSVEGRCFLNVEADRPPTPPYINLSAVNYQIEARPKHILQQRLEETARCLKSAGRARASSAKKEPFVYVGAPGIAFAFQKLASIETGERLQSALDSVDTFLSPDIVEAGLEEARVYPQLESSLLSGPGGVCIVLAIRALQREQVKLVERGMVPVPPVLVHVPEGVTAPPAPEVRGDKEGSGEVSSRVPTPLSEDFKRAARQYQKYGEAAMDDEAGDEWLYGRAGYLFGCLFLDYLSPGCIDSSVMGSIAAKIISSGRRRAEESGKTRPPLRFAWHHKEYIGAAHGYFGILHMLLHVRQILHDKTTLAMIRDTLSWLLELETSKHNWPAVVGDHDAHLCHFCHGAAGAAIVFSTAGALFNDRAFKHAAERAGDCVWRYGLLKKGAGICHGIAGSGYSLLAVYQLTQHPAWLDRAIEHTIKAFDEKVQADSRVPDNPYSLFEGVAGAMCLLTDLLKDPKNAAFPFFQIGF